MGFEIINTLKRQKGLTNAKLASLTGITQSTIDKITSGVNKNPKLDTLQALCDALGCTLNDFSTRPAETKTAPSLSDGAMKIAKIFDGLDAWGQKALLSAAEIEAARCDESSARARAVPANVIPLRCSVQSASAGTGMYLGPEEFETVFVEENDLTRRASFGVPVRGDSMEPVYHDGDILIVEAAEEVGVGETGVFTVSGEGFVKQRGEGALISLNPKYAPIALTEDTWCNGRVIGVLAPAWIVKK